jgi:hypothetical protein
MQKPATLTIDVLVISNGYPTYGNYRALVLYHVREANCDDVKLDDHSIYQTYINLMGNYFYLHLKGK